MNAKADVHGKAVDTNKFDVTLDDTNKFKASTTQLSTYKSPNRGDTWVVKATEFDDNQKRLRVFLIVFPKTQTDGEYVISSEDKKGTVSLEIVDYTNPQKPISKLALSGTIQLKLDISSSRFTSNFTAVIEKSSSPLSTSNAVGEINTVMQS